MNHCIISMEGVLAEGEDLRLSPPTWTGKAVFEGLKQVYSVILITSESNRELVREWMRRERIQGYANVITRPPDSAYDKNEWKLHEINGMRSDGMAVDLYVDVDPEMVKQVFLQGVTTLLLSSPKYSRPEWRPEGRRQFKPWDSLTEVVERENLFKIQEV